LFAMQDQLFGVPLQVRSPLPLLLRDLSVVGGQKPLKELGRGKCVKKGENRERFAVPRLRPISP